MQLCSPLVTLTARSPICHELRETDTPHNTGGIDTAAIFYAVDGSRLRYDSTDVDSGTLYLPDGTRYVLDAGSGTLIDRHGNTLTYSASTRMWTDTLGRPIGMPIPAVPTATDYEYELPGLDGVNGGLQTYTFKWRELDNSLAPGSPALRYWASHYLPYPSSTPTAPTGNNFPQPQPTQYQSLFTSELAVEADLKTMVVGEGQAQGQLFNPIVLNEIVLPDGRTYKFTYNIYGEIEKVIYPTGAYETYQIGPVGGSSVLSAPYEQAERGVLNRDLSESGSGTDLLEWAYTKVVVGPGGWGNGQEAATRYRVVAPDTTCSEVYKVKLQAPVHYGPFYRQFWDFDYVDPRNGATVETRAYGASTVTLITECVEKGVVQFRLNNDSDWAIGIRTFSTYYNPWKYRLLKLSNGSEAYAMPNDKEISSINYWIERYLKPVNARVIVETTPFTSHGGDTSWIAPKDSIMFRVYSTDLANDGRLNVKFGYEWELQRGNRLDTDGVEHRVYYRANSMKHSESLRTCNEGKG